MGCPITSSETRPSICWAAGLTKMTRLSESTAMTPSAMLPTTACRYALCSESSLRLCSSRAAIVLKAVASSPSSPPPGTLMGGSNWPRAMRRANEVISLRGRTTWREKRNDKSAAAAKEATARRNMMARILCSDSSTAAVGSAVRTTTRPSGVSTGKARYNMPVPTVELNRTDRPGLPCRAAATSGRPAWFSIISAGASESTSTSPDAAITVMRRSPASVKAVTVRLRGSFGAVNV